MKKRERAAPASAPAYHPTTEQVLSEVGGEPPYLPKRPRQKTKLRKGKPTVTIAPGLRSTRDVFINRPKYNGDSSADFNST